MRWLLFLCLLQRYSLYLCWLSIALPPKRPARTTPSATISPAPGQWAAARAAAHAVRAGAPRQRLSRQRLSRGRTGRGQRRDRVWGGRRGAGSVGGGEAADRGEEAVDVALVAGEEHAHALTTSPCWPRPHHLALLAVHDLVAAKHGHALPRVEHLLAHRVAARQRLRARAGCLGIDVARRGCTGGGGGPQGMREDAVGLRRLAPIRVESLPRAVVRSQRIAGARWG